MQQSTRIVLLLVLPLSIYAIFFFLKNCCEPEGDPGLRKGIQLVRYLSDPREIKRSSFLMVYPEGKPSNFVKWMFSPMGTAQWTPPNLSLEMEEMESIPTQPFGMPMLPQDTKLFPFKLNAEFGKQVVVKSDDAAGLILVEGYLNANGPPEIIDSWPLELPKKK